jgi:hypothetical protein
LKWLRR